METSNLPDTNNYNFLDRGERSLLPDEIEHLAAVIKPVYDSPMSFETIEKFSRILAESLLREEISFKTSLELWKYTNFDVEILKEIYSKPVPEEVLLLSETIRDEYNNRDALRLEREIKKTIRKPMHYGKLTKELETNTYVILDKDRKQTFIEREKYDRKGNLDSIETVVLEACLKQLTIYDSPISEEPRQFKAVFDVSDGGRNLVVGPGFREEVISNLKDNNLIASKRYGEDVITASLNLFAQQGLAEMKTDIETPGFFYNHENKEILFAKYEIENPDKEEIKQGLRVLEEFGEWYGNVKVKLATIFKWGLIAPFGFTKKQMGTKWIPWLFLYGQPGSGKSRLGQMVLYMWNEPDDETNNLGGGSFDTEARIGGCLSKSTFPILVDEPAGVFAKDGLIEIIKNAVMKTVVRSRYRIGHLGTVPAYCSVILTSNVFSPPDGAFNRRMETLSFTHNEAKTQEEMNQFDEIFQMDSPKRCKLNALKAITQAAAVEIIANPDLLEKDWKDLADTLIRLIYMDVGEQPPEWILQWVKSETMEDLDNEQREAIRILISESINREIKRIPLVDDEYRPVQSKIEPNIKSNESFNSRVWYVVNEGLIPWMVPFHDSRKNKDYVCLTLGFKSVLQDRLRICQPLKGTAQLMGWSYAPVRLSVDANPSKVIKINFEKFVNAIYQRGGDQDHLL